MQKDYSSKACKVVTGTLVKDKVISYGVSEHSQEACPKDLLAIGQTNRLCTQNNTGTAVHKPRHDLPPLCDMINQK